MLISLSSVGYIFHYLRQKIDALEKTKKDLDEEELVEQNVYQAWSGSFADGKNSLIATLVWKKECSRKKNTKWLDWNGEDDGSVTNRDFYIQRESPSFEWQISKREADTKGTVKEIFMDGWNSVILLKFTVFVEEEKTRNEMNAFLKGLMEANQIDWQRCILSKEEINRIFD